MSYKQEKIIVIVSEFVNDKREYYPITDIPIEKVRFFYKDDDGLFKAMSSSDYAVRTETNEMRLYITNEKIKNESLKFQVGYEINFSASEYETSLPVLSVLVEMYNTLIEDSRTIFNYVKKQCFISDDKTTSLILPNLPSYTVWCMGENGEMFALPVNELYSKFGEMLNKLKSILADYTESKKEEIRGATFFPHLTEDGTLSWTNDKNKPNPEPVNIKGPAGTIENVTASVNSNAGVPSVKVTMSGTKENRSFDLEFQNLKGDPAIKGVDYYTPAEKEQFTNDTKAIVQAEGNKVIEEVKKLVGVNPAGGDAVSVGGLTRPEIEKGINDNLINTVNIAKNGVFKYKDLSSIIILQYDSSTFSGWKTKATIKNPEKVIGAKFKIKARETPITQIRFTASLNNILINDYIEDVLIETNTEKELDIHFFKELDLKVGDVLEVGFQCNQLCGVYIANSTSPRYFSSEENFYTTNGLMNNRWASGGGNANSFFIAFLENNKKDIENNKKDIGALNTLPIIFNENTKFSLCDTRNDEVKYPINDSITGITVYANKNDIFKNGNIVGIRLNQFNIKKTGNIEKAYIDIIEKDSKNILKTFETSVTPNGIDDYILKTYLVKEDFLSLPEEFLLGIRTTTPLMPSYESSFKYKAQTSIIEGAFHKYAYYYSLGWTKAFNTANYLTCPNVEFYYSLSIETDDTLTKKNIPADSFKVGEEIKRLDNDIKRLEGKPVAKLLKLPEKFDLVAGDTFELFYKGIINASNTDCYDITIDCNKNIGQAYKRKYVYTPKASEVGKTTVTFNLLDNLGNKLESQEVVFNIINVPANPSEVKNILCVGDSLLSGGEWANEFRKRLMGTSSHIPFNITNVNFLGSKEAYGTKYEGYGGWTFNSYNTENKTDFFMYITGSFDKTEVDQHSVYKDINGRRWKLETIGASRMKIISLDYGKELPSTGTLTWVSGGQNHSNIVYTSSERAEGNPFWNVNTKAVDFIEYAKKFKVSKIDYVYVLLGWNNTGTNTETYINQCKQFLDNILKDFPNCKIGLLGLQVPSQNGFGENYGISWEYYSKLQHIWKLQEIYQTISKEPKYTGKVDYINISAQFDSEFNMPHTERNANIRTAQKEYVQTNGVHPANDGYMQIADAVTRNFLTKI